MEIIQEIIRQTELWQPYLEIRWRLPLWCLHVYFIYHMLLTKQRRLFHHLGQVECHCADPRCCSSFRPEVFLLDVLESSLAEQKTLSELVGKRKWNECWERCMEYALTWTFSSMYIIFINHDTERFINHDTDRYTILSTTVWIVFMSHVYCNANAAIPKPQTVYLGLSVKLSGYQKANFSGQLVKPLNLFQQQTGNPKLSNEKTVGMIWFVNKQKISIL